MKIVQIIRNFSAGGAERFVIDLSNQLFHLGNDVTIIRFFDEANQNTLENSLNEGVHVLTIKKKPGLDSMFIFKLFKVIKGLNPDVLHTHLNGFNYSILPFLFLRNIKYFHTIHSMPLKESKNKLDFLVKKILFKFKFVFPISISEQVHIESLKYYGDTIKLIYNGRVKPNKGVKYENVKKEINRISKGNVIPTILNIGNFKEAKNQKILIQIINELNESGIKVNLVILGGVKSGLKFNELSEISNFEFIHFLGTVDNSTDYMYCCDYFCLSSLWEGMPISLIEAFSTRCLSICTPAGGIINMVKPHYNGLLSSGFDKESLKKQLKIAISLPKNDKEVILDNAYNDFINLFSIEQCADRYFNYFLSK